MVSYMPLSTSVSSNSTTPFPSTSLSASSLPMVQAAVGRTSGNAAAQLGPSATAQPCGAASSLNVSVQRRSRSGLESSHTPTSARAASLGAAGLCWEKAAPPEKANRTTPAKHRSIVPAFGIIKLRLLDGRLRHWRERALAGKPGDDVVRDQLVHRAARRVRGGADVRQQHDVLQLHQFLWHVRLVREHVEAGG